MTQEKKMIPSRSSDQLSQKELLIVPKEMNEWKDCLQCRKHYREKQNFGRLTCFLHPGIFERFSYTCCRRPIGTRGCLRSDHISEPITKKSEAERFAQLKKHSLLSVPVDYFYYGILPPLNETVLFHSARIMDQQKWGNTVCCEMPFGNGLIESFDVEKEKRHLKKNYRKMPLLAYHYKELETGERERKRKANNGWRNSITKEGIWEDEEDSDGESGDSRNLTKIDIPFVIVRRIVV